MPAGFDRWAWGTAYERALGVPLLEPVTTAIGDVVAVSAGYRFSTALPSERSVWSWGDNEHGQLGDAAGHDTSFALTPAG